MAKEKESEFKANKGGDNRSNSGYQLGIPIAIVAGRREGGRERRGAVIVGEGAEEEESTN